MYVCSKISENTIHAPDLLKKGYVLFPHHIDKHCQKLFDSRVLFLSCSTQQFQTDTVKVWHKNNYKNNTLRTTKYESYEIKKITPYFLLTNFSV